MTRIDEVADLLGKPNCGCAPGETAARELDDAGHLMPDLPEPVADEVGELEWGGIARWEPDGSLHVTDDLYGKTSPHYLRATALALIAAAPGLAKTVAGMRWEYAVENSDGDFLDLNDDAYSGVEVLWTWHRTVAEETQATHGGTIVRCLGGPMEVVE